MKRIMIASRAKASLDKAKAHRRNESMNWAIARGLLRSRNREDAAEFASDAIKSRKLARYHARMARASLLPGYTAAKRF